jgi:serine/threonine protein kinase
MEGLVSSPSRINEPLNIVEERIETQESLASEDNGLSPRSKAIHKIQKKIKHSFSKGEDPPQTTSDNYKIGKVLGKGAFGKVNLAIHRLSNKFVALKSINKTFLSEEDSKKKVMQEFNMLRRIRHHRSIVRLYESFET